MPVFVARDKVPSCSLRADGSVIHGAPLPDGGGQVRVSIVSRSFDDFSALEWMLELENISTEESPILEDILPLDLSVAVPARERVRLHHANGSMCRMDDFLPLLTDVEPGSRVTILPRGGRSSNGALPFMNLARNGCGMILAIGWSGQWKVSLERDADTMRISAGMEKTHVRLHPGEKIRTPRILMLFWEENDESAGTNRFRQLLLAHYLPRIGGDLVMPVFGHSLQWYFYLTDTAGEDLEMKALARTPSLGVDTCWIDACWYGRSGRTWYEEVGSWTINRDRFPHGLAPVSAAAHSAGLKFLLWFEPERVRKGSIIHQQHPEFLLRNAHDPDSFLLDLGNPAALRHVTDLVCGMIEENGIDIYRQDFNFDPLPFWRQADSPEREGIAEIRHIEGLYAFWDEIRRRFPRVWIDNCSSGGRRIDLETLSRSLPLWPSDFSDVGGLRYGMGLHVGDQCINAGLARWVPLFGGGVSSFTPYSTRGQAVGGFAFGHHIDPRDFAPQECTVRTEWKEVLARGATLLGDGFPAEAARAAIAEARSLRPFILGDMHLLVPLTADSHDWCAFQFHRDDMKAGVALIFRRHQSPFTTLELSLKGIDTRASYEVSLSPGYDEGARRRMTGMELAALRIEIPDRPGSILLRYHREDISKESHGPGNG